MEKKNQCQIHEGQSMTYTFNTLKEGLTLNSGSLGLGGAWRK